MATVYLDEQGAELKKHGELLIVEKEGAIIAEIPLAQIDRIVIIGNVQITIQAAALLLERGIPVSFVTTYGNYRGKLKPPTHKNVVLRLKQFARYHDSQFRLEHSKAVIRAKLKNSRTFLQKHARNKPGIDINYEINEIEALMKRLDRASSIDEMMGIEGISARHYFSALGRLVKDEFSFQKRTRRPPQDPVNAMLSLGYTLLFNEMYSATEAIGFDPYLGFMHEVDYGRASLAVDMVEEFRYLIDGLVLTLINKDMLTSEDFTERDDGGIYMKEKARETFYRQYEKRINTEVTYRDMTLKYRRVFLHQAEHLARVVMGEDSHYQCYEYR